MQRQTKAVEELFQQLRPENQKEVQSYIEYLIAKQEARSRRQPEFPWAGALEEMREEYSSVELQHEIRDWRSEVK
jgi:hypothetical protein